MTDALDRLREENIPYLLCSYSSLDRYFRVQNAGPLYVATDSSIVSLAKAFDNLQFPGLPLEDAAVQADGRRVVFRCVDSLSVPPSAPFTVLRLLYDPRRNTFLDRLDLYPDLRAEGLARAVDASGTLVLYNTHLWKIPDWCEETGLRWITEATPDGWSAEIFPEPLPGMALLEQSPRPRS